MWYMVNVQGDMWYRDSFTLNIEGVMWYIDSVKVEGVM